jgi:branched-chain amino acid transport system ATP-binding protein/branched-chain amino acid transport system permease protein
LTGARANGLALEVRDLRKAFGGVRAVDGCSFAVPRGTICGLIGPNGSGKSTTFDLLTGVTGLDGGAVVYEGEDIAGLKPYQVFRRGITRTFQMTRVFREMTVLENMLSVTGLAVPGRIARERADELLALVNLGHLRTEYGGRLSYGQQKLLEFARALMTGPDLILLDEPAGGVNPSLIEHIAELIRELNRDGISFLVVEHNMPLVLELCDPVIVLAAGRCIAQGPPAVIQRDPEVLGAYLGGDGQATERLEV